MAAFGAELSLNVTHAADLREKASNLSVLNLVIAILGHPDHQDTHRRAQPVECTKKLKLVASARWTAGAVDALPGPRALAKQPFPIGALEEAGTPLVSPDNG